MAKRRMTEDAAREIARRMLAQDLDTSVRDFLRECGGGDRGKMARYLREEREAMLSVAEPPIVENPSDHTMLPKPLAAALDAVARAALSWVISTRETEAERSRASEVALSDRHAAEVASLRAEIARLRTSHVELEHLASETCAELEDAHARCAELQDVGDRRGRAFEEVALRLTAERAQADELMEKLRSELMDQHAARQRAELRCVTLESTLSDVNERLSETREELATTRTQLNEERKERATLSAAASASAGAESVAVAVSTSLVAAQPNRRARK
jgi:septal ring factor EnvC (AmiA/AmiB activator)